MIWLLLAGLAWSEPTDPAGVPVELPVGPVVQPAPVPEPVAPATPTEFVSEELDVYGQQRVIAARQEVIRELKMYGYDIELEKGDAIIMRHQKAWRGEVWLHRDGWVEVKRQPIRVEAPPSGAGWCVLVYPCVKIGGQVVSRRRFMGYQSNATDAFHDEAEAWTAVIADVAVEGKLEVLPGMLDGLWQRGEPIDPNDAPLSTVYERKQALMAFWASRTDTPWGEAVRAQVESFLRGVVQDSETPLTPGELAEFNARSGASRPLTLERRPVVEREWNE